MFEFKSVIWKIWLQCLHLFSSDTSSSYPFVYMTTLSKGVSDRFHNQIKVNLEINSFILSKAIISSHAKIQSGHHTSMQDHYLIPKYLNKKSYVWAPKIYQHLVGDNKMLAGCKVSPTTSASLSWGGLPHGGTMPQSCHPCCIRVRGMREREVWGLPSKERAGGTGYMGGEGRGREGRDGFGCRHKSRDKEEHSRGLQGVTIWRVLHNVQHF